jgi:hypothetical protein
MFHHSINKVLAIACLLSVFILTFVASAHRQDAQGAAAPGSLATTRFIGRKGMLPLRPDPCSAVTLASYDNIYALLKKARSEAEADVGTTLLGAPDALENRRALDGAMTQLQSTRALWISTYGSGHRVLIAAEAYQIFTTLEAVIPSINTAEHWAITEASHSGHTANHGRASFDFASQALVIANQMRVDAGQCYMAAYE